MDARALARQGYTYAEIGRLLGRDWRTVKRYLETGAQPVYRRRRMPSMLDEFKPLIDQWLAATPGLLATRIHQDLVRDYGFEGSYNTVRRYVERSRPRPTPRPSERFETRPGHQAAGRLVTRGADQDQLGAGAAAVLLSHGPRPLPRLVLRADRLAGSGHVLGLSPGGVPALRRRPARAAL